MEMWLRFLSRLLIQLDGHLSAIARASEFGVVGFLPTGTKWLLAEAAKFLVCKNCCFARFLVSQVTIVYDLLANKRTVNISAHEDDVNSCCWADPSSGNVLVSASDDAFLKVWYGGSIACSLISSKQLFDRDRRSLGPSVKPSGVLIGHTEGITYVSAKGDGRYVISNGKDQALRLWDLRKMRSNEEFEAVEHKRFGVRNFDYRFVDYS